VVKRDRDLTVFDLMQDLEKVYRIPVEEQVYFLFLLLRNLIDFCITIAEIVSLFFTREKTFATTNMKR